MSDEIYTLQNGKASMAYVGKTPWHGLGNALTLAAHRETWIKEAGLEWELLRTGVQYYMETGDNFRLENFVGQDVLYRSDTGVPMSVVSSRYQIVQPREVIDFFADFCEAGNLTMETAGSLAGGSKIWALAHIDADFEINENRDFVRPYVLLATSCDKTMATTGKLTSIRVVCNNTLSMAISEKGGSTVKVPHSTKFDPESVQRDLGLLPDTIAQHANTMRALHRMTVTDEQAMRFFLQLLKTDEEKRTGEIDLDKHKRQIPRLWSSYKSAPGAEDTAFGLVQAVTHSVDFNPHARSADTRLNSAWFGQGDLLKTRAYALARDGQEMEIVMEEVAANRTSDDFQALLARQVN